MFVFSILMLRCLKINPWQIYVFELLLKQMAMERSFIFEWTRYVIIIQYMNKMAELNIEA